MNLGERNKFLRSHARFPRTEERAGTSWNHLERAGTTWYEHLLVTELQFTSCVKMIPDVIRKLEIFLTRT